MAYAFIVLASYVAAFGILFANFNAKNSRAAALLPGDQAQHFLRTMNQPKMWLLVLWGALVFGTVGAAVLSGVYWLVR